MFNEMSTNVHFWNGSTSTSVAFFVSSRTPALTPSSSVGCCGCCCCFCFVSQLLFNVTLGAGLGVATLSNITRSQFWEITRSVQSLGTVALVMIDPALWINVSNILHLDCVSNKFGNVPSEEQCDHHEVSLHLCRYRIDSEVWRRLLVELCHSLFLPRINPLPKMDWEFHEIPLWKMYSFY